MKVEKLGHFRPVREVVGRDLDLAAANRLVPDHRFVGIIDRGLRKSDPDWTVPWESEERAEWCGGIEPRSFLDVGCGLGAFTTAVLKRLNGWGCLEKLEDITLVEKEARLKNGGEAALRAWLNTRVLRAVGPNKGRRIRTEALIEPLRLVGSSARVSPAKPLGARRYDIIVASHITYYFGDGSGKDLVEALATHHLNPGGIIWLVIRRKASPIYKMRAKTLATFGLCDAKPYDYAEHFESEVLPELSTLRCLARADKDYLTQIRTPSAVQRTRLAHLLMWRQEPLRAERNTLYEAASTSARQEGALFSERHFILGCRHGG